MCKYLNTENSESSVFDMILGIDWAKGNSLAWEFAETASLYARIIISELFLHPDKRTFASVDIGGIAGGKKFIVKNILFKMAGDTLLSTNPKVRIHSKKS